MHYNNTDEKIKNELNINNKGLNDEQVNNRQQKYGKNILPKNNNDNIIKIFLNEIKDTMIILLIVAIIISFIASETMDAYVIIFIVLIDIIMGVYQENKANKTAQSLSNLIITKVKVIRNGNIKYVNTEELTIGDYVILESGNKVSADMQIVKSQNLMVDESILTGESIPVNKTSKIKDDKNLDISEKCNMLFSGTTIVKGRAEAVVTNIGINTEIGKIASSINNSKNEKSPLTIRVEKLSKQISLLVLIVAIIITLLLIIKKTTYNEIFLSVIALSISAMPEGLPLALTMALTIASNKMAKKM